MLQTEQKQMLQTDVKLLPRPPIGPPPVRVQPLEFDCLTALHDNLTQNQFLAVQDSSIGDIVTHSLTHSVTLFDF